MNTHFKISTHYIEMAWKIRQEFLFGEYNLSLVSLTTVTLYVNFVFNPYSAGIDFRRQNLTSVDVSDV